jgi:hypothetical protein
LNATPELSRCRSTVVSGITSVLKSAVHSASMELAVFREQIKVVLANHGAFLRRAVANKPARA